MGLITVEHKYEIGQTIEYETSYVVSLFDEITEKKVGVIDKILVCCNLKGEIEPLYVLTNGKEVYEYKIIKIVEEN